MPQWLDDLVEGATKYSPLIKTGVAALSTYASFKDQQKKNELQKAAYDDYMAQADAAGHAARAAIDINYTPMTVSGVPTTKADVTDFTAVAARGGLMSIPNKQRKRYAFGPNPDDLQTMEEMSPPFDPREEGISIGQQVFYDTGRGDRANAAQVWDQMQNPDKAIFDFDFEIFFMDGGWRDMIKSQVDVQENIQLASAPSIEDSQNEMSMNLFNKPYHQLNQQELDILNEMGAAAPHAEGIMQAAKGGRIGYRRGRVVHPGGYSGEDWGDDGREDLARRLFGKSVKELLPDELRDLENEVERLMNKFRANGGIMAAKGGRIGYRDGTPETVDDIYTKIFTEFTQRFPNIDTTEMKLADMIAMLQAEGVMATEGLDTLGFSRAMDKITPESVDKSVQRISMGDTQHGDIPNEFFAEEIEEEIPAAAKGGRIKKDNGGIMNLGGLEKDYRTTGGFVPIGAYEKKDDVPARLSKNEFVMTADAVRAAGGGSINRGAQRMYDTMKHLEAQPQAKRMTA